jgi:hypothetical protein
MVTTVDTVDNNGALAIAMAVIKHFPNMCESLSSIASTGKKKRGRMVD